MGTRRTLRRGIMPLLALAGLLGVLLLAWQPSASALTPRHYDELEFPALRDIEIPAYERYELPNGLVVYLLEDHELPLVSGSATFRTGARFEPADKVGLANLTGEAMRLGGTTRLDADSLNQQLEQRAASIETGIDLSEGSASFSALSEDTAAVFALFADVVQRPAFADDKIDLLKRQYGGGIARRNDDPDGITSREFRKLVYGADSPYARTIEYATLAAIDQADIEQFYRASIRPEHTILGIVGDFDSAQMKQWIADYFGEWQGVGEALEDTLPAVEQAKAGVFMVSQPQLTQSYVELGHLGGQLDYPDHAALAVMNEVMNGFSGRLFNEVRSRQGLAYSVYAFWAPRYDHPGLFIGGGQTRSEATVPFIQSTLAEIDRIRTTAITDVELAQAKDAVLNSFVFNFQSPGQTLARLIRYEYYGYPQDFVFQFQDQVREATAAQVQAAAQARLNPNQLVILVVGNPAEIRPGLDALAPNAAITPIDITIPQPQT
ncbi:MULTISPECIES: pitrilysin family protein [Cyanophyceae]|uniref:M16 family metallopeptidase n=1 Tax=Cyanophyceae TaxID=3028117 RepID=UPI0016825DBE|nr:MULTISPECIES: pitrilysin family protein [Cyanophyceae]MBD1916809.1 insulinase family protein [Phormidium sp. FACHB-77]MBD2029439.1 insulinase family protein [Phormidium sp. FACHB-322]MBD2052015.1 insulinase family protein [Leptolyngbya sp. FACHB-60]